VLQGCSCLQDRLVSNAQLTFYLEVDTDSGVGFGLRVQHLIFELARAAGLKDLAARTPRARNKMNVVKATWELLCNQRLPDEYARARGKKLVDVRKVYYGGSVH